jgi:pSer/pThr/pTyr-binding forkhead associated (FHA) protein
MPRLLVSLPDGTEVTHELTEDTVTVGRVSDNTIQIEDASVSSHHAELSLHGDDYVLKDLGSTNGTRVNGTAIAAEDQVPLQPGFVVRFGSISVRYLSESAGEQQPMPEESEPAVAPAATSVAPVDFANASPFQKKKKEKDTSSMAVLAVGVLAILAAGGAIFLVLQMQPPSL